MAFLGASGLRWRRGHGQPRSVATDPSGRTRYRVYGGDGDYRVMKVPIGRGEAKTLAEKVPRLQLAEVFAVAEYKGRARFDG